MEIIYVQITKTPNSYPWYATKIGYIYKVDEKQYHYVDGKKTFHSYLIRISKSKFCANFGYVVPEHCKMVTPTLYQQILIAFGFNKFTLKLTSK